MRRRRATGAGVPDRLLGYRAEEWDGDRGAYDDARASWEAVHGPIPAVTPDELLRALGAPRWDPAQWRSPEEWWAAVLAWEAVHGRLRVPVGEPFEPGGRGAWSPWAGWDGPL